MVAMALKGTSSKWEARAGGPGRGTQGGARGRPPPATADRWYPTGYRTCLQPWSAMHSEDNAHYCEQSSRRDFAHQAGWNRCAPSSLPLLCFLVSRLAGTDATQLPPTLFVSVLLLALLRASPSSPRPTHPKRLEQMCMSPSPSLCRSQGTSEKPRLCTIPLRQCCVGYRLAERLDWQYPPLVTCME